MIKSVPGALKIATLLLALPPVLATGACDGYSRGSSGPGRPTALRGKITAAMANQVREELALGQRTFTIESPGGYLFPAINIGKALRDAGATLIVDGKCMSACVLLLQTVPDRRALPDSDIRLHRAAPEYGTNDRIYVPASGTVVATTGAAYARGWLIEHAVPADIVDRDTAGWNTRTLQAEDWTRLGIRREPWR